MEGQVSRSDLNDFVRRLSPKSLLLPRKPRTSL